MDNKSGVDSKDKVTVEKLSAKPAAAANSENERPAEVKKSISAEPTIHEEEGGEEGGDQQGFKSRASVKGNSAGSWRKQYNNRRKSTELAAPPQSQSTGQRYNNKGKFDGQQQQFSSNQKFGNEQQAATAQSAKDRRHAYTRANSHRGFSTGERGAERPTGGGSGPRNGMARSMSINQQGGNQNSANQHYHYKNNSQTQQSQEDNEAVVGGERRASFKKRARGSTSTTGGGKGRLDSNSVNSMNGESFDYDDDMELDEPFTDSDEDSPRHVPHKPCLIIPRGRIRTLSGTVPPIGYSPKWGGPTMCLSCLQFFDLPDQIGKFADHLLEEHKIVVVEVELIVDPKRYIEHWRQRFAKEAVNQIFPKIVPDEGSPYHGKADYYFEMSERIPEDYSLRQRLAMRRLEEALACQQREREELCFSMQCIFCRYVARGNRSKIIHHLYMIHHLNLGSPDNLVFVAEYIDHLKEKLQKNECIYCEKTFSDRTVLMDHMRKRNHREVNPKNNYYDKFYIINYLELGKRWLDVLAEDFEDTMPTFVDSDDEEEEESWHEWQEDNTDEDQIRAVCLFCNYNAENLDEILKHTKVSHTFDLLKYIEEEKLDLYKRMKFLNFIRKQTFNTPKGESGISGDSPKPIVLPEREQWDVEESLVPMFGNDHLPWMLESHLEAEELASLENASAKSAADGGTTAAPAGKIVGAGGNGEGVDLTTVEGDWDNVNKSFAQFRRQTSIESSAAGEAIEVPPNVQESIFKAYIEASKANTVEEVVAEDWPDLSSSILADQELYKSLR